MRNPVSALYYPASVSADATLKKSILLFDEIHFMDRPSFMFEGKLGMIGSASPLRPYEQSFRENGVPLYIHPSPGGIVHGELLERVKADISDPRFLAAFQDGLRSSARFRELHISPGSYGGGETHQSIYKKLADLDLDSSPSAPWDLLIDDQVKPFDFSSREALYKSLYYYAAQNSVVLNFALTAGERRGFLPIADAFPYASLISAKFARAIAAETGRPQIPFSDLSLAIFDELVSPGKLEQLTWGDTVKYRKGSEEARNAFLEMLSVLHAKAEAPAADGDYQASIQRLIETEIRPAAREFKDRLEAIHETLFGKIQDSAIRWIGGSGLAHLLTGMSWEHMLMLATGATLASTASHVSESQRDKRVARKEYAISYVLDIESHD